MLFIVAMGTALLCNAKAWGTTFFRSIYFLPVVMSFATASYVWLWLYSEMYGVIIYALEFFGFGGEKKNLNVWKTGTSSMWAVNAMVTWKFSGIQMIILIAGLPAIRDDFYAASKLMGASRWQTIWHVTLPLLRPSIALALILSIAGSIQAAILVTGGTGSNSPGGPANSSDIDNQGAGTGGNTNSPGTPGRVVISWPY